MAGGWEKEETHVGGQGGVVGGIWTGGKRKRKWKGKGNGSKEWKKERCRKKNGAGKSNRLCFEMRRKKGKEKRVFCPKEYSGRYI